MEAILTFLNTPAVGGLLVLGLISIALRLATTSEQEPRRIRMVAMGYATVLVALGGVAFGLPALGYSSLDPYATSMPLAAIASFCEADTEPGDFAAQAACMRDQIDGFLELVNHNERAAATEMVLTEQR